HRSKCQVRKCSTCAAPRDALIHRDLKATYLKSLGHRSPGFFVPKFGMTAGPPSLSLNLVVIF
ncbi:MAG: hypothetical protein WCR20_15220, partial [Verrucomicrobiota bacterium]